MKSEIEILRRAILLLCLADRCFIENPIVGGKRYSLSEREEQRLNILNWLKDYGYYPRLTEQEKQIVNSPITEEPNTDILRRTWQCEAIEPLLWYLGITDTLTAHDVCNTTDYHAVLKIGKGHNAEEILRLCRKQNDEALLHQQTVYSILLWRLNRRLPKRKKFPLTKELQKAFGEENCQLLDTLPFYNARLDDLIVRRLVVSQLTKQEQQRAQLIARWRYAAFQWVDSELAWDEIDGSI